MDTEKSGVLSPSIKPLRGAHVLINWCGWLFMLASCLLLGPPYVLIMIVLFPFGLANRFGDAIVQWWVSTLRRLWRVEIVVEGLEHVAPEQTYVVVSNHRSHLDAVACIVALKPRLRFGFVVKRSLSLIPIWGWFIWLNGYIPVDRERRGRRDQLASGVKYLQRGRSVLVFPEGTRAPDHRFRNFKKGAAVLAIRSGRPVLPITVSGTASLLPKNSLYVRDGVVRVQIHPAIETSGFDLQARDELVANMRDVIVSSYRLEPHGPMVGTDHELLQALVKSR